MNGALRRGLLPRWDIPALPRGAPPPRPAEMVPSACQKRRLEGSGSIEAESVVSNKRVVALPA
eukprot:13055132-Alexandrium_andersonii.AAC.1